MELYQLKVTGFPFGPNDISLNDWKLIAEFESAVTKYQIEEARKK